MTIGPIKESDIGGWWGCVWAVERKPDNRLELELLGALRNKASLHPEKAELRAWLHGRIVAATKAAVQFLTCDICMALLEFPSGLKPVPIFGFCFRANFF